MSRAELVEPFDEQPRLQELFGLSSSDLQDVIAQGFLGRTGCTSHHPKTYPGLAQWADTVRALRDKTVPLGWTTTDDNNFPLSIHPSKTQSIAVQTGDRDTGITGGNPANRAAKGTNTEEAVAINQRQLTLFDNLPDSRPSSEGGAIMWVLLYHVAPNEIRYELSLPMQMVGGKISSWQERIVFPAIQIDLTDISLGDTNDHGPELEVPIQRRGRT